MTSRWARSTPNVRDLDGHALRELHTRIHATTVYVTHDQLESMFDG